MRKIVVTIALLVALLVVARPFVSVVVDDGIAGVSARTSVQHKYETLAVWRY